MKKALFTILSVLALDQILKIWVKLNFHYGESLTLLPGVFELQFVENPGMAFGWVIPGAAGKLALSIFRIVVVCAIIYYLFKIVREKTYWGYVICISLIVAGALGNIIDSAVYGLVFDKGAPYDANMGYHDIATFGDDGYARFLMGNVVDMFHITVRIGDGELFPPVFNVADSSITVGIVLILLFQRRFFRKKEEVAAAHGEQPLSPAMDHNPESSEG